MATKTAETDKPWAKPRLNYRRGESREDAVVIIFASDGLDEQDIKSYTGRGRVPPDRYRVWASALQVDPALFVKQSLRYYDPITYDILFGDKG